MTQTTTLETISTAIAKYDMTARMVGDLIAIHNKKGRLAATVSSDGTIDRKFDGNKVLMGSLVRDAITNALDVIKREMRSEDLAADAD